MVDCIKVTLVNRVPNSVTVSTGVSGGGTWGTISGTITDQSDLVTYVADEISQIPVPPDPDWGNIGGTITDQTDLVDYIDAEIAAIPTPATPTLDSVTTEGNTTTNAVEVGGLTAVNTSSPVVKLEATSETNPTSNEVMGTLTFSRKFTDPDTPSLIETLYNDFTTRVEADGGEVNGSLADVTTDISDLVSGKYQLDTAHIKSEYTGVPFNTSSDMVFYTSTGTSVTEKFRITKDGDIEVKDPSAGVILRSENNTALQNCSRQRGCISCYPTRFLQACYHNTTDYFGDFKCRGNPHGNRWQCIGRTYACASAAMAKKR